MRIEIIIIVIIIIIMSEMILRKTMSGIIQAE